jgi:hypothetical protein
MPDAWRFFMRLADCTRQTKLLAESRYFFLLIVLNYIDQFGIVQFCMNGL